MINKKMFKKNMKRAFASFVAVATVAVGAFGGMTFAQKTAKEEKVYASSSMLSNEDRGVIYANSRTDFRDESIYFLITTRFYDGDKSNNHRSSEDAKAQNPEHDPSWRGDFAGLIEKLDYIKALGFTAIWITPVVENDSGYDYHGYHAYNFSAVDKRYESNGITYQDLIDEVHARDMKIIQDVVLNHTCNWGEENLLQITSDNYPTRNQVVMNGNGDPENIYHHNGFCGGGDWDNYEAQRKTIADDCFDLETENPKVYNYLVDCYTDYINMGVDGFRIDTVKHISRLTFNTVFLPAFKEAGGEDFYMFGEVCTKGHDVWYRGAPPISTCFYTWADSSTWTSKWSTDTASNEALVEAHYNANMDCGAQPTSDNAFLKGNEYHAPDYSQKSGMDVIDFQMHWSFNDANSAFRTALGQDKYFNDSTWNVVYVDSHDYAPDQAQTQRYTGGTTKWAENLSLMFTFRGIPCIYYGSEIEFQAGKPIDKGPTAKLQDTGRAYYGDHIEGTVEATGFSVFDNLSGEVEATLDSTLSQHIMRLNRIRQAVPALRKGQYSTDGCNGNIAFKRRYTDATTDSFALVAISGGATFTGIPNGKYVDAVTGDVKNVTNGTLQASVSGQGNMKVYVLDTAKTPAPGRVIPNGDYLTDGGSKTLIKNERVDPIGKIVPTDIKLDRSSVSVLEGKSVSVTATVLPSDATNKKVTWTSDNESVAIVSNGTITGIAPGTATITAKTHNNLTAKVTVTVNEDPDIIKATGVTVAPNTVTLTEGDSTTVSATVAPSNATNKTVTWTSADTAVATVNSAGLITAVKEGTTTITAKTHNGKTATVTVTVEAPEFPIIENGVYFEKPSGWGDTINVYMWKSGSVELMGGWPGKKIDKLQDNIYGFSYTGDTSGVSIIFNDGSNQTADLEFKGLGRYDQSGWKGEVTEKGKVTVKYVDEDGNILSTKSMSGDIGTSYTTSAMTFENYTLKTTPSNANGTYAKGTTTVTYVYAKEIIIKELSVNASANANNVKVGTNVTFTANAAGGSGSYKYSYIVYNQTTNTWGRVADSVSASSYTWTAGSAGTRIFYIDVTDSNGTTVRSEGITVVTTAINDKLTATSSASSSNVPVGSSVTFTATANGGSGSYKYSYIVYNKTTNTWARLADKISSNKFTWTAGSDGVREFYVDVTDTNGTTVRCNTLTVTTSSANKLTATAKASASNVAIGSSVTFTANATGGSGSYTYSYIVYNKTTNTWARLADCISSNTFTWTAGSEGTREFYVDVKDSKGTIVRCNVLNVVTSKNNTSNLKVVGSATSSVVSKGGTVAIIGTALEGTAPYTYSFVVYNQATNTWFRYEFSSSNVLMWTPTTTGARIFYVEAKDSTGKVVRADGVTINVK